MALAGCITTIFSVVAKNSHVKISDLEAIVEAKKPDDALTITEVKMNINVQSDAAEDKIKKILGITLKQCPVEKLFRQANVKMDVKLNGE